MRPTRSDKLADATRYGGHERARLASAIRHGIGHSNDLTLSPSDKKYDIRRQARENSGPCRRTRESLTPIPELENSLNQVVVYERQ